MTRRALAGDPLAGAGSVVQTLPRRPSGGGDLGEVVGSAETLARRLHRLAFDVHDGPMQNLAVIGFAVADLRRRMRALLPPEQWANLDTSLQQITEELGAVECDLRLLIGTLEGEWIKSTELREAIESEIREFEHRVGIPVAFVLDDSVRAETDSQRIALQSVTRAALANVAKHAAATQVSVRLHGTPGVTTLEIEDNGCGFDAELPLEKGHIGLSGMQRRVEMLGGELRIASRCGGPTTITASLHSWRPENDPAEPLAGGTLAHCRTAAARESEATRLAARTA